MGTAPSTLAKAVQRLEASLGVKLFHRTTRQVTPTPDGERLYHRCQRVLAEIEDLHADAAGTRAVPSGLLRIDMPVVPTTGRDRPWQFLQREQPVTIQPRSRLRLNDGEAMVQAALTGRGIAPLPHYMVEDEIAAGQLVELLPSLRPAAMPISAVYASQRLLPPRVRVVLEALSKLP